MMTHAGKVVRLRQKLADITGAVTGIFGRKSEKDPAVAKLDALKVKSRMPRCAIGHLLLVHYSYALVL